MWDESKLTMTLDPKLGTSTAGETDMEECAGGAAAELWKRDGCWDVGMGRMGPTAELIGW